MYLYIYMICFIITHHILSHTHDFVKTQGFDPKPRFCIDHVLKPRVFPYTMIFHGCGSIRYIYTCMDQDLFYHTWLHLGEWTSMNPSIWCSTRDSTGFDPYRCVWKCGGKALNRNIHCVLRQWGNMKKWCGIGTY